MAHQSMDLLEQYNKVCACVCLCVIRWMWPRMDSASKKRKLQGGQLKLSDMFKTSSNRRDSSLARPPSPPSLTPTHTTATEESATLTTTNLEIVSTTPTPTSPSSPLSPPLKPPSSPPLSVASTPPSELSDEINQKENDTSYLKLPHHDKYPHQQI